MSLWFEALPSPAAAPAQRVQDDLERLHGLQEAGIERIVVPEVLDGAYATMEPLDFAKQVQRATGIPAAATVSLPGRGASALQERAAAAAAAGIDCLLVVGAANRDEARRTLPVEAALHALAGRATLGVVTIPARRRWRVDEPHRLLRKQRAGAKFALSQIVFDAAPSLALRRAYVAALAPWERPIPVMYSLAPVLGARDLAFLQQLGADLPPALAAELERLPGAARLRRAQEASLATARSLAAAHEEEGLGPYGFCISHVRVANVEAAIALAQRLHQEPVAPRILAA